MSNNEYAPHNWVIVEINSKEHGTYHKLVAGWSGGYLEGNSWRYNSGIANIAYDKETETYSVYGLSGSVYQCRKSGEGERMNITGVLSQFRKAGAKVVPIESILKKYSNF